MKRRWFQIRLSTLLVANCLCAVFLAVNLSPTEHITGPNHLSSKVTSRGWPWVFQETKELFAIQQASEILIKGSRFNKDQFVKKGLLELENTPAFFSKLNLFYDILVGLTFVLISVCLLEIAARRREARKP